MKKLFLLAAAALFVLSSCVKGNDNDTNALPEGPAILTLDFKVPNTKAPYGSLSADDGTTLKNLTIFVLNGTDDIIKSFYVDCSAVGFDWSTKEFPITTSAEKLIGIGNTKENLIASGKQLAADVLLPYTLATLKAQVGKLEDITFPDEVLMSGIASSVNYDYNDLSDVKAAATLELELIPAKLNVVITDNRDDLDHADAWLVKDVAILYSAQYTHYVKNATDGGYVPTKAGIGAGNAYYYAGIDPTTWTGAADVVALGDIAKYTNAADATRLVEDWHATSVKGDVHSRTFYTLPIASTTNLTGGAYSDKHTIISIRLEKQSDGTLSYFPTTFSAADGAVATVAKYVKSGDAYTINITLKGSATTGGGTDPETPVTNATLTVTVTPKGWNIVNPAIVKEFGS